MKRLLDVTAKEYLKMTREDLIQSIKASEGRVVLSENIVTKQPSIEVVTNSELARAFGADLILLNCFDVFKPFIYNLDVKKNHIKRLKELVGRPIGVNLEPVSEKSKMLENKQEISEGRKCSKETLEKLNELGVDFLLLTGNPATGVSNKEIKENVKLAKKIFKGVIIAGKMHTSGVDEKILDKKYINEYIKAGADIILLPSYGTIGGIKEEDLYEMVEFIHSKNALAMSAIGTSQESASVDTIREISLKNKAIGFDIHHIGDSGYSGLAPCENIFELSKTIRGLRHTLRIVSTSNER